MGGVVELPPPAAREIRELLRAVRDPEIPVLEIDELGILREVLVDGRSVRVVITPTYSGCPAMRAIAQDIVRVLADAGFADVTVEERLAPAWTTDWMTAGAREKLRQVGIAPPAARAACGRDSRTDVACPQCGSTATELVSEFGSTACKALYRCRDCLEPFDHFKCI